MITNTDLLNELKKISKILTIGNGFVLETELSKYATTDVRKVIWALIDGKNTAEDIDKIINKIINKTKRGVDIFLRVLERAELLEERKYGVLPIRKSDYIPSEWIQLTPKQSDGLQASVDMQTEEKQHG